MLVSRTVLKKALAATLAVATLGATMVATTGSAEAYWRGRGGWHGGRGWGVGAGILGGLAAGALIAGAASRPAYGYPVYGEPVYDGYEPSCYIARRQVWIDHVRWTYRNVRVCE